jgi:hypothetical protein
LTGGRLTYDGEAKRIADDIWAQRLVGRRGDVWDNLAIARATVEDELGERGWPPVDLDPIVRDTLIVHDRQDTAHALLNTSVLLKRLSELTFLVYLQFAIIAVMAFLMWRG